MLWQQWKMTRQTRTTIKILTRKVQSLLKEKLMGPNSVLFRIVISILLLVAAVLPCQAENDGAGIVSHVSGPLFAKNAHGVTRTLSKMSIIDQGDTVITEKRTYARLKFTDGGEVTLRPGSTFVVESYAFNNEKGKEDKAVFGLVKGSLRAVTGQVSKRGNPDAYKMKTPTATIGVRGTSYDLKICLDNCPGLANGIYFSVTDGVIQVTNGAGSVTFGAGSYGYVKNDSTLPVVVPFVPNLGFELPPMESGSCGVR
jgi:hypothetical protein